MAVQQKRYIPKRAVIETTLACNLRCRHCGSKAGKPRADELTTAEMKQLFQDLAALGCERVTLSGGEPTMRPDWPTLIKSSVSAGMRVGMFTNAILFADEEARLAKEAGLESVAFSVDGLHKVHDEVRGRAGHFETLTSAMKSARQANLPFAAVTHINRLNLGQLPELMAHIAAWGAHSWQIQLGTDMGNMRDNKDLLIRQKDLPELEKSLAGLLNSKPRHLRILPSDSIGYNGPFEHVLRNPQQRPAWNGCQAGLKTVGIESNGNVKGCLAIMAGYNEEGASFVEGNIRREPLATIWHRIGGFAYNRQWSVENLGGFCRDCRHATQCRGGCRAKVTASGNGVDNPMCFYRACIEEGNAARLSPPRGSVAAAALFASFVGFSGITGCDDGDTPEEKDSATEELSTDYSDPGWSTGDESTDYSDPDWPTDIDYSDPDWPTDADYSDPDWPTDADYSDPGTDAGTDDGDGGIDSGV